MKKITLATFRKLAAAEETMMRACMPQADAADTAPLPLWHAPAAVEVLAARRGSRLVRPVAPLTFTLAEVRS
jgi:hypothetical protein